MKRAPLTAAAATHGIPAATAPGKNFRAKSRAPARKYPPVADFHPNASRRPRPQYSSHHQDGAGTVMGPWAVETEQRKVTGLGAAGTEQGTVTGLGAVEEQRTVSGLGAAETK
jgi:hypothetical protein